MTDQERFYDKVYRGYGSCHLWMGGVASGKYGAFTLHGRQWGAHRAAWYFEYGDIPAGKQVLHRCDVKLCVNPAHLFLGDAADNVADMVRKNRHRGAHGEKNGSARCTRSQVIAIRKARRDHGYSYSVLARMFDTSAGVVRGVVTGSTWKHVEGDTCSA